MYVYIYIYIYTYMYMYTYVARRAAACSTSSAAAGGAPKGRVMSLPTRRLRWTRNLQNFSLLVFCNTFSRCSEQLRQPEGCPIRYALCRRKVGVTRGVCFQSSVEGKGKTFVPTGRIFLSLSLYIYIYIYIYT